jgi:hypothetical protein
MKTHTTNYNNFNNFNNMPYYWSRVWEIYAASLITDSNTPGTIINDLAWLFLEQGDTPESLYNDYNASNYREPCSDEQCDFKNWYDDIMSSGNYQEENLLAVLFQSCRTLTEREAITILHAAPCHVIIKFMNTMEEEFAHVGQDDLDYEIARDGRQSPYNEQASNEQASNEPSEYYSGEETDDMPSLDGSSDEEDDDMPPLDGSSDEETCEPLDEMPDTNSAELVSSETWIESDYSTDYTTDDSTDYETDYESDYESHRQVSRPSVSV